MQWTPSAALDQRLPPSSTHKPSAYALKLRLINALLMMLASFHVVGGNTKDLPTTRQIDNWQTLEASINYLLGEAFKPAKPHARVEIDVRRVPMNPQCGWTLAHSVRRTDHD